MSTQALSAGHVPVGARRRRRRRWRRDTCAIESEPRPALGQGLQLLLLARAGDCGRGASRRPEGAERRLRKKTTTPPQASKRPGLWRFLPARLTQGTISGFVCCNVRHRTPAIVAIAFAVHRVAVAISIAIVQLHAAATENDDQPSGEEQQSEGNGAHGWRWKNKNYSSTS